MAKKVTFLETALVLMPVVVEVAAEAGAKAGTAMVVVAENATSAVVKATWLGMSHDHVLGR